MAKVSRSGEIRNLLQAGKTDEEIMQEIKTKFPDSKDSVVKVQLKYNKKKFNQTPIPEETKENIEEDKKPEEDKQVKQTEQVDDDDFMND